MSARGGTYNRYGWWNQGTIDATAGAADSALGVTERLLQTVKDLDNVVWYLVANAISSLDIRISMATNDHDAVIDVYDGAVAGGIKGIVEQTADCMLQRAFTITAKAGQQTGITSTDLFCDTLTVTNDRTLLGVGSRAPGTDHLTSLHFGLAGANIIVFHGHTTCDGDAKIWLRGYANA